VLVGIVVVLALVIAALFTRRKRAPGEVEPEKLPAPPERVPELELPPSEALEKAEAERARLVAERDAIGAPGAEADAEALKKAEYRLKKADDAVARERKRVEAQARAQAEAEAAARARAEAQAREAAEKAAAQKKIEAVAGKTLAEGLHKTRSGFMGKLGALFGAEKPVDEGTLAELEDILFTADIGVKTATDLFEVAREKVKRKALGSGEALKAALRAEVARILAVPGAGAMPAPAESPQVIMVVGVNGAGKTTTIGKLSAQLAGQGKAVLLAAGDTFRAAATEQLEVWAQRAGVPLVKGLEGSDPGAVVFDAIKRGVASRVASRVAERVDERIDDGAASRVDERTAERDDEKVDVVICDTAGRLHTQQPLMDELKKVKRVMGKALASAPHEVLLVLDATNGQNAIAQARQFHEALGVTGIVLTKLDGTAKGGVIIGICDELKLPVRYVGVGEGIEDLRPFDPDEFVQALFA